MFLSIYFGTSIRRGLPSLLIAMRKHSIIPNGGVALRGDCYMAGDESHGLGLFLYGGSHDSGWDSR